MPIAQLTDAYCRSAKCDANKRLEIRDAEVSGLEFRVSASGAKSWRLHYTRRSDGKRRVVSLGSYPAVSLKEARAKAKRHQGEIEDSELQADPAAGTAARREAKTFRQLADEWTERHAAVNRGERTRKDDKSMMELHVFPAIGGMKASSIAKRDILRMLDGVAAKPDARGAASKRRLTHRPNRVFELVRTIIRWGIGRDLLTADPTLGLKGPIAKERERDRDLSPTEIHQLWAALERAPVERRYGKGIPRGQRIVPEGGLTFTRSTALAMMLSLATAQRIGEVTGVALTEMVLEGEAPIWTVPAERSKNGQANRVPLSPLAVRLIREAMALHEPEELWLFPSPLGDGPINPHAPTKALDRARPAIGIEDFRIHDLRRTAATRMAELGISPHTISLVLNHVSARKGTITGKVYVQYSYDREKREALNAWGARLEQITSVDCHSAAVTIGT
jgi:integrase